MSHAGLRVGKETCVGYWSGRIVADGDRTAVPRFGVVL
jgi:hypothetical protein